MPRGPFQGTWVSGVRPTIVTAPDAIVYINGSSEAIGCPQCRKKFPFNKYITSIQVDLSVDSPPGSASFNMSIPRHAVDDFYFDGTPILSPMMEIEIYAKGYYLVEGLPQYYPIFWGLITEVNDTYSSGENTVSVHANDILKWWELTSMATNSSLQSPNPGALGMSIFGNVFYGKNPYDIIWTLAQQSFGDVIVGTGNLNSLMRETTTTNGTFTGALTDIMLYWNQRFQKLRSGLMLYGINGTAVRGDTLYQEMRKGNGKIGSAIASHAVAVANGGPDGAQAVFDPTSDQVVAMKNQINVNVPFWTSEYQTKMELAGAAKEALGYEFYMDVDGSVVFKPPFYNLDVLSNKPVSWIQDIDVIDWDFSTSESEVVTQVQLQGSHDGNTDYGLNTEELTPFTSVTDYHLLRQYGWRSRSFNSEFLGDPYKMFYVGLDVLDKWNARRHRATVTIPMRPELRMGFPIYIAPKDEVWYITGISHNIAFGGRATTSLTLTAKRKKWIAPRGIGTIERTSFSSNAVTPINNGGSVQYSSKQLSNFANYNLKVGEAASFPPTTFPDPSKSSPYDPMILRHPKTGRIVGYPNAVMVYSRPFEGSDDTKRQDAGQRSSKNLPPTVTKQQAEVYKKRVDASTAKTLQVFSDNVDDALRTKYVNNRYHYGLNSAGAYLYAHDIGGKGVNPGYIQEILLLPASKLHTVSQDPTITTPQSNTALIRPVSDERGFEVVGVFRYGRGVALRDGQLVQQTNAKNAVANVDLQTALAGDLYATLNAQSQGLTSLTSAYENPADALARLTPDDLQSAGTATPDGKVTFSNPSSSFVDSAPLGSPQQVGLPTSIEVGQLSKALTIAELTPTTDEVASDSGCPCLLGRSDLTFLSNGYNIKVLNMPYAATPDNSTLGSSLFADITQPDQSTPITDLTLTPEAITSKVDTFLFNLYNQLDSVHQQYENVLRGEPSMQNETQATTAANNDAILVQNIEFGQTGGTPDLTPPFSAANRASLGDPTALAIQASSAAQGLANSFSDFGKTLNKNTQITQLQGQISNAMNNISSLQAKITKLQQDNVLYVGDKSSEIAALQRSLATEQQNLNNDQLQLQQLTG